MGEGKQPKRVEKLERWVDRMEIKIGRICRISEPRAVNIARRVLYLSCSCLALALGSPSLHMTRFARDVALAPSPRPPLEVLGARRKFLRVGGGGQGFEGRVGGGEANPSC